MASTAPSATLFATISSPSTTLADDSQPGSPKATLPEYPLSPWTLSEPPPAVPGCVVDAPTLHSTPPASTQPAPSAKKEERGSNAHDHEGSNEEEEDAPYASRSRTCFRWHEIFITFHVLPGTGVRLEHKLDNDEDAPLRSPTHKLRLVCSMYCCGTMIRR